MKIETHLDRLLPAIDRFSGTSILVIGDLMIDHFVYGSTNRISPEAPIPVLLRRDIKSMPGGAGNVAMNLLGFGARVDLVGIVGDDANGEQFEGLCAAHRALTAHLVRDPRRATSVKTRFVAQSQQLLRLDEETPHPVSPEIGARIIEIVARQLPTVEIVVLSDYAKGLLTPEVCRKLLKLANEAGKPVLVDPKNSDFSIYNGAALVSPNLREIEQVTGVEVRDDERAEAVCRTILDRFDFGCVLLTRGAAGMSLMQRGAKQACHITSQAKSVYDVSGAGDTVISTLAAGLATGLDLPDAVLLANHAAGLVVAKTGTGTVSRRELRAALGQLSLRQPSNLDDARERIQIWRDSGKTIGFTNGCFDLLHLGHLHSLEEAKRLCDILIVGVNSDTSVKRLKGEDRPIQDQMTRARILSCLEFCDLAIVFDEDTPQQLIEQLIPDFLFKGDEYRGKKVAGSDIVQGNGGQVILISRLSDHSTTGVIARMT